MCTCVSAYMQEDIDKCPVLFGTIAQGSGDVGDIFDRPRYVLLISYVLVQVLSLCVAILLHLCVLFEKKSIPVLFIYCHENL